MREVPHLLPNLGGSLRTKPAFKTQLNFYGLPCKVNMGLTVSVTAGSRILRKSWYSVILTAETHEKEKRKLC